MSFTASTSVVIKASTAKVWAALVTPESVKQYLWGTEVTSDWKVGSSITYKGVWEGKPYEDKGTVVEIVPEKLLKSTYFSALSGKEDKPENYNTIIYELAAEDGDWTKLTVTQDNNPSQGDADKAKQNWSMT